MSDNEEQNTFIDIHFDITKERIKLFLQQFAPGYKGYILDQTPKQLHSKEYIVRIYYEDCSSPRLLLFGGDDAFYALIDEVLAIIKDKEKITEDQ